MTSSIMGAYVLALWLHEPRQAAVGRLGRVDFPAGWYLYAGSALGPGGVPARLARHHRRLADGKKAHWHVDYLRELAAWGGAWARSSDCRLECAWAAELRRLPQARLVARGFGASDCGCPGHLVHVPLLPDDDWFNSVLGAARIAVGVEERRGTGGDGLDDLIDRLLSGDDDSREAAALALRPYGLRAVERLGAILAAADPREKPGAGAAAGTRWWAARALAAVGHPAAIAPLVGALEDEDPDVRACAALALGRLNDPSRSPSTAAPFLAQRLADESGFVASIVADALAMLGEPAVEALAGILGHDSAQVRLLAVRALGRTRSQEAIGPLFGALEDPSYLVRYYAQQGLEALGVGMSYLWP